MNIRSKIYAMFMGAGLVTGALAVTADAQGWPNRPVTVIVPFAAGGGADAVARILFDDIAASLGQPFNLDFRPGASGIIGTHAAAQAAPDGNTLLFTTSAPIVHASFRGNVPYDPVNDLVAVANVVESPMFIAANAARPYHTFQELVEYALAHPGEVNALLAVRGGIQEEGFAHIQAQTGAEFNMVPYSGSGELIADLLSGVGDISLGSPAALAASVQSGDLRWLMIMVPERFPTFPDVPTVDESDEPYRGIYHRNWYMVLAPAGTPAEIVTALNAAVAASVARPEIESRLNDLAFTVSVGSPADAAALVEADIERLGNLIESGIFSLR